MPSRFLRADEAKRFFVHTSSRCLPTGSSGTVVKARDGHAVRGEAACLSDLLERVAAEASRIASCRDALGQEFADPTRVLRRDLLDLG